VIREFEGHVPSVPDSAFVSEMAYLVGDVTVEERASLWPFVCIRGDYGPTVVGAESNVQDFTMLHEASVGRRVTVGHGVVIDRADVGPDSLVGIGSTVLPDATVGSNAVVAAGAVVTEGQEIPDGHVAYGTPAQTEPISSEHAEAIGWYCDEYLQLKDRYQAEGTLGADDVTQDS
jgi:carbonic anhydrase/acetyltransferase-like protein (isoleucine patch superfamily)